MYIYTSVHTYIYIHTVEKNKNCVGVWVRGDMSVFICSLHGPGEKAVCESAAVRLNLLEAPSRGQLIKQVMGGRSLP